MAMMGTGHVRRQMRAVAENATLGVIASLDEFYGLSRGQHFGVPFSEPLQVFHRDKAGALVVPDQLFNRALSISGDRREDFLGDGEDASPRLVRKAIIEHTDFVRTGSVLLDQKRSGGLLQVSCGLLWRADQFHTDAALAHVRLQNERVFAPRLIGNSFSGPPFQLTKVASSAGNRTASRTASRRRLT